MKIPATIGACADLLYKIRQERLKLQKEVEALEAQEHELREHIIATLPKSEASGVQGKVARVSVVTKDIPQVKDWNVFYEYVRKNKAFDLLQRRLADKAVKDRLEDGKKLPGVELFRATTVSLNKI